jgi:fructose-bisphosphate aldolase class II
MPIATTEQHTGMLDGATPGGYALAGVNVSSAETLNAALCGFAEAQADGITHVSTGGGEFLSGAAVNDMVAGARSLAAFARVLGQPCPVLVPLQTDNCPPDKLDGFLRPLLLERRERGEQPLFHSQMFDASTLPLEDNLRIAAELLDECACADAVLESSAGCRRRGGRAARRRTLRAAVHDHRGAVAGGRGAEHRRARPLPARRDVRQRARRVRAGNVELRPWVLATARRRWLRRSALGSITCSTAGWGRDRGDPRGDLLRSGEMDIDPDTQYAFTRAVAGHMFAKYDGVPKVDGGVGRKKAYDPGSWGREAEAAMATRVGQACEQLGSAGTSVLP